MMEQSELKENKLVISGFWLKIIAFLTMTMDHVGYYISSMNPTGFLNVLAIILRVFGRLALPLFCFMIAEGIIHTKSFGKYIMRLSIVFAIMLISYICTIYIPIFSEWGIELPRTGIIFVDLILGAIAGKLLRSENKSIRWLFLLPLFYGILSYAINSFEVYNNCEVYWLPFYLRTQGGWYSILLIIGFSVTDYIANWVFKVQERSSGLSLEVIKDTPFERRMKNVIAIIVLALVTFLLMFICKLLPSYIFYPYKGFAIAAGILLFFYSGLRGYNKKWFNIVSYCYYPMHFILIFIVFELILVL